jgi:hypothetical protein
MDMDAKATVVAGAAVLTEYFGNDSWTKRINPEQMNVVDCESCPLGQLFGYFHDGCHALGLVWDDNGHTVPDWHRAKALGFDAYADTRDAINAAWVEYITASASEGLYDNRLPDTVTAGGDEVIRTWNLGHYEAMIFAKALQELDDTVAQRFGHYFGCHDGTWSISVTTTD